LPNGLQAWVPMSPFTACASMARWNMARERH
jgi:hypothetical protein